MSEYKYTCKDFTISLPFGNCDLSDGCEAPNTFDTGDHHQSDHNGSSSLLADSRFPSGNNPCKCVLKESQSQFDYELTKLWEAAMGKDLFRYKLAKNCLPCKVLPGRFQYIAQLNPDRAEKRRKPQQIMSTSQAFDPKEFNFNKVSSNEILMRLLPWHSSEEPDEHLLLINVSPLEYGHVLLTPFRNLNRPQRVTGDGLRLAIELCLLSKSCDFRLGFNSLCGFASVNHEHYHAYYLSHRLYIEYASLTQFSKNCYVFEDAQYPPGFCFILDPGSGSECITDDEVGGLLDSVLKLTEHLHQSNVGHNIFITRGSTKYSKGHFDSVRIFVWARAPSFGAKGCDAFNPALCELAGHFPIKNSSAYEMLSEEFILNELHGICDESFKALSHWILSNF